VTTLLVIFAIGFGASFVLTPLARALALRYGLVDYPDARRKMHAKPIAAAGGLAIFCAVVAALSVAWLAPNPLRQHLFDQGQFLFGLIGAAALICAVGFADDRWGLRGRHKLVGQLVAVAIVMASGVWVRSVRVFDWHVDLGLLAGPFTAFWLLGAINALNLLDGMDGLLACVGLILSMAMAAIAAIGGHWAAACLAVALTGALSGFLRYNFPPARIFLGDSGSMLIGLVLGTLAIRSSLKAPATVALAAPLAVLAIPILDTAAAIIRRKLTGRSIYTTDRGHLHHVLLDRGMSCRRVLLLVSACCFLTVIGALISLALQSELFAILSALAVVGVLILTRVFGYAEFVLLTKRLSIVTGTLFRGVPRNQPQQLVVRLQGSVNWTGFWDLLVDTAEELNLRTLCLDVNAPALHEGYHARWDNCLEDVNESELWHADVPLWAHGRTLGRLAVTGNQDGLSTGDTLVELAKVIEELETILPGRSATMVRADPAATLEPRYRPRSQPVGLN
jgi:UDP-GlcNAc:undecaprenyl-phosphate/decaprenyl-phosphate GlcNAc-1-phosphate transferase